MTTVADLQQQLLQFLLTHETSPRGSLRHCCAYLSVMHTLLTAFPASDVVAPLRELHASKQRLHAQLAPRWLTRSLAEALLEVEAFTHYALDLLKGHDHFVEPEPRLEFRLDWRPWLAPQHTAALYTTEYGAQELILSAVK